MPYDFALIADTIFHNIIRNAEAHPWHVNDIFVAFYTTRRLNANEHNEPRVRSVGRRSSELISRLIESDAFHWHRAAGEQHAGSKRGFWAPRKMKSDDRKFALFTACELADG